MSRGGERLDFGGPAHRRRGWLLFLLKELGRLGLAPVSHERLHLLLFYAAVLTPIYGVDQPLPKIVKYRDRPFYPEAQRELESLAAQGYVANSGRKSISDTGWFSDSYRITLEGLAVVEALAKSEWGRRARRFVADLVDGFARLSPETADDIIHEDSVYRDEHLSLRETEKIEGDNRAVRAANWVANFEEDGVRPSQRDSIALYFRYLQERRAA